MSLYKYNQYLTYSSHEAFDKIHNPGEEVPYSGIYRCEGCGNEAACNAGQPLPTQNHSQHTSSHGKIRWKLVVATQ
jgi:hypothetical protein